MLNDKERAAWLAGLKVGYEVCYQERGYEDSYTEVTRLVAENLVLRHRLEDLRFQLHVAKTAAISGAIALALLIGGIIHG